MAQQYANAHLLRDLQRSLHGVLQQALSDTLSRPIRMHRQSAQHSDRDRIRHVPLYATCCQLMRYRTCGQRVVANHVLLVVAYNKTPGGTLALVLARSTN